MISVRFVPRMAFSHGNDAIFGSATGTSPFKMAGLSAGWLGIVAQSNPEWIKKERF
jgi:hypothetical protein